MVRVDVEPEPGFKVISQAVIQAQLGIHPPLVLHEKAIVAVVQIHVEVVRLGREISVLPGGGNGRRSGVGIEGTGADRRAPEKCRYAWSRKPNERRRARRRAPIRATRNKEIGQAREDIARWSESWPDHEVADVVAVKAELDDVVVLYPGQAIGELHACFVVAVEGAKIVTEKKQVRDVKVGLSRNTRESIIAPGPLDKRSVHEVRPELRRPGADDGLIAQQTIAAAARHANAAAVQRFADQHVVVGSVLDRIPDGKSILIVELLVDFYKAIVDVGCFQDIRIFRSKTKACFDAIESLQYRVAGWKWTREAEWCKLRCDGRKEYLRIRGGLGAALAFVVYEEESLVFFDRPAQGGSELILAQDIGERRRLQERAGIHGVILKIFID